MKHFILIDDDVVFNFIHTEVIKRVLPDAAVDTYNCPSEGLEYIAGRIERNEKLPDVLLLDIRMPELDGFELLAELEKLPASSLDSMAIYMLTSSLDDRDRMKALRSPLVRGFKNKPLTENKLMEILTEITPAR